MSGRRLNYPTRILLLLMAAVFLLPVYGSWVDVDYAERQPNHKHIYLGRIDLNHHRSSESKDVVNLPDRDATGQPIVILCIPAEEMIGETAEPADLIFGLAEEFRPPEDAFLPPPDHPPRI